MIARIRSSKPLRHYLKEWRKKAGKTQQQLADLLDTEKGQISNWENSRRSMTMEVQAALAYALGIEPHQLFLDPDMPSADELLRSATPEKRQEVIRVISVMLGTGTDGRPALLPRYEGDDSAPDSGITAGMSGKEDKSPRLKR